MTANVLSSRRLKLAVAIALVAVLAYANSLGGDFVWDDRALILQSSTVQSMSGIGEVFVGDFFSHSQSPLPYGYYRPVTTLSYVVDWSLWGNDPLGFHATNTALHSVASILVFLLLLRLGLDEKLSLTIAVLFAVHPIHTESVSWISGRTDVLAFLFAAGALLLDMYAYGEAPCEEASKKRRAKKRKGSPLEASSRRQPRPVLLAFGVVLFTMALLAKEMAVVLPIWVFLIATIHDRSGFKRAALRAFPYVMVVAAYAMIRFVVVQVPPPGQPLEHTAAAVILSVPITVVRYLGWMLLPLDLSAYVQNPYVLKVADIRFLGAVVVLAALTGAAVRLARRNQLVFLFSSMLAMSFVPVINIVRVASPVDMGSTMAERFCYFPSFPFLALAVVAVSLLLPHAPKRRRTARTAIVVLFLLVPSVAVTWNRAGDWRDEVSLFSGMVQQVPDAALPWSQLALAHLRTGRPAEARKALDRADQIDPADLLVLSTRTTLLVVEGRVLEAIPLQEELVRSTGRGRHVAKNNLAYLYRVSGRSRDARRVLEQVIKDGGAYGDIWFNLGEVEHQEKQLDAAVTAFERAWESSPNNPQYDQRLAQERVDFARMLAQINRRDEAIVQLQKVLEQSADQELRNVATTDLDRLGRSSDSPRWGGN